MEELDKLQKLVEVQDVVEGSGPWFSYKCTINN
ncbi:hypothetical protein IMAU10142_02053 [Lactobacillus helveticus]|jgi:hypothetical protein|uniref:Uncharacterized protein n=1 Tax=Lactobacillus helveticus CIRM-BIA 953 TaxID=1226335 RepID=U4QD01_LACHE|nr:hypothetical protein [Lactobacillus helveticus]CDI42403.1 Putative uncharacterized protein [Lactobacillus helveticus CIRM-BIA 953]NRN86181.1 hypothetical protein [Lactobacillus helveticus]NRN90468.1 hypothetical protein [Lactobacillus helveticus]NRO00972.1 hypothetical protein [Lactobacillus helveticus]